MIRKNKKTKTGKRHTILALALIMTGYVLAIVPFVLDLYSRFGQTASISQYQDEIGNISKKDVKDVFDECDEYNQRLYEAQTDVMYSREREKFLKEEYEKLPKAEDSIGLLEIPKIDVYLQIMHGTKPSTLLSNAGHVYMTSLPTGSKNANAVIAGHTGMPNAELFTYLIRLKKGDVFYIHVLGQIHAYRVTDIVRVAPDKTTPYMLAREGKDQVTLYTCTPYGLNTDRLLVMGDRVTPDPVDGKAQEMDVGQKRLLLIVKLAALLLPVLVLLILLIREIVKAHKAHNAREVHRVFRRTERKDNAETKKGD